MLRTSEMNDWEREPPRTAQERTDIRKRITETVAPVLKENGFLKCNSTFLRLHGDRLLQSVSVCHRAMDRYYGQPTLQIKATAVFDFMVYWQYYFQGIRSSGGLEGIVAETAAGLRIRPGSDNSYLAYASDLDAAIERETQFLKTDMIPLLDRTVTCYDAQALYRKEWPYLGSYVAHIRHKNYDEALESIRRLKESVQRHLDEDLRIRAMPKASRSYYDPGALDYYIARDQKEVEKYQSMMDMLEKGRINDFCPLFNQSMDEAYLNIGKVSKGFIRKYPRPPYFENLL